LLACTSGSKLQSIKIEQDGEEILRGEIDRDLLFSEFPGWQKEYENYIPDSMIIDTLQNLQKKCSVEIFMGTWCHDSKREVSRFYKILDQCNTKPLSEVKMWAVDQNKRLPGNDLTDEKEIHFVATFIFVENDIEIGRIVEQPFGKLESDILEILKRL